MTDRTRLHALIPMVGGLLVLACNTSSTTTPLIHRPVALACSGVRPAFNCGVNIPDAGFSPHNECRDDAACTAGMNGRCSGNTHNGCRCSYDTCQSDADCASGMLCSCNRADWNNGTNGPNVCLPSNCRVDADCGSNGFCSPSLDPGCGAYLGVTLWRCHTPQDTCGNDSDCKGLEGGFGVPFCGWRPELGHWACSTTQCAG